ncbi:metallophosphoesterase [Pedococcus dokdonensis]|uniref:metallophosphoesterase n=1 Tax=Pedococcus dokdonensis TaxID=443156 RepID=UPI0012FD18BA|nr:metallophosphoesterase [Pedococcus dokdonensis]
MCALVGSLAGCTTPTRSPAPASSPPPASTAITPTTGAAPTPEPTTEPTAEPLPAVEDPATTFSFAVIPDTQPEVRADDPRTDKRNAWLVAHRGQLNLQWVLHSGDVQDWDTPDHQQWVSMSTRFRALAAAGIPFIAAPGNHDTAAVCEGGSACPGADTAVTVRDTTLWNTYYPPSYFGFEGLAEPGRSDNGFRTFRAGGDDWLVLSLEIWPRPGIVDWAKQVVASHPHHNVIVLTHMFLEGDGSISTTNGGYGATTPTQLWDALKGYPNVVMTFSGHTGQVVSGSTPAADGHPVAMFLQAMHAPDTNPVRIVTVDTAKGTITTQVRSSFDRSRPVGQQDVEEVYPYSATITGMRWARP